MLKINFIILVLIFYHSFSVVEKFQYLIWYVLYFVLRFENAIKRLVYFSGFIFKILSFTTFQKSNIKAIHIFIANCLDNKYSDFLKIIEFWTKSFKSNYITGILVLICEFVLILSFQCRLCIGLRSCSALRKKLIYERLMQFALHWKSTGLFDSDQHRSFPNLDWSIDWRSLWFFGRMFVWQQNRWTTQLFVYI